MSTRTPSPSRVSERPRPAVGTCPGAGDLTGRCGRRAVAGQCCARCAPVRREQASVGDRQAAAWAREPRTVSPLVRAWWAGRE